MDNRVLRHVLVTCEIFKKAFLDRFFPREFREAKVEKFINLRQGGMIVLDYYLKFKIFSKYAPSLVSNPRDEMSCFLMRMSDDLVEECRSAMLHDNINISHLLVYAKQGDESRLTRNNRKS